jgi:hypothetical protein
MRRIETSIETEDFEKLKKTIPYYDRQSLFAALRDTVALYKELRAELFSDTVTLHEDVEKEVMQYLDDIQGR